MENENKIRQANSDIINEAAQSEYKYGFVTDIETHIIPKGLNEDVVRYISGYRNEPEWLLEFRLKAFRHWQTLKMPRWAHLNIPEIDYQDISYFAAPKTKSDGEAKEIDPEIKKTFDKLGIPRENILSVTMPGFGTTGRTYNNACTLCRELGTELREISIVPAVREHFANLGHDENIHDLTYENSQARERTQILMDLAGKVGGIVIGTGDLSELALGWCTYNGDHMSMYGVNVSVPKTLVKTLVCWASDRHFSDSEALRTTLRDIVDTPISPELLPKAEDGSIAQITEDVVGPYELHDFFLYHFFRFGYDPEKIYFLAKTAFGGTYPDQVIKKWLQVFLKRFYTQQFKRSCLPDGPKVGSVSLSPRGDWRMPSDIASPFKFE